jgi:transcriptional regulator with XRE-family HTH domain
LINSTFFELIIIEEKKMGENIQKPQIIVDSFEELTGKISSSGQKEVEEIGQRVKSLREEKGLSLDELSKLTGFEVELLSDIEKDKVQPQLGTVIKLSKALDSAFGRLVSGVGNKLFSITRKDERKVVSRSTSHKGKKQVYTYKSLAPEVKGRHMEAMIVQLEENPDQETSVHEGEEFIYVLDGVVSLKIGEDAFALEPGDSVYYLSTTPHLIAAKSGKATILAVLYEG